MGSPTPAVSTKTTETAYIVDEAIVCTGENLPYPVEDDPKQPQQPTLYASYQDLMEARAKTCEDHPIALFSFNEKSGDEYVYVQKTCEEIMAEFCEIKPNAQFRFKMSTNRVRTFVEVQNCEQFQIMTDKLAAERMRQDP